MQLLRLRTIIMSFSPSLCKIYSFCDSIIREYPNQNHPKFNIHRADFHKSQFLWRLHLMVRETGKHDGKASLVTSGEKQRLSDPRRDLSTSRRGGRMTWRKRREAVTSPHFPQGLSKGRWWRGRRDATASLRGKCRLAVGPSGYTKSPPGPCCAPTCQHPCRDVGSTHQGLGHHFQGQPAFRFT